MKKWAWTLAVLVWASSVLAESTTALEDKLFMPDVSTDPKLAEELHGLVMSNLHKIELPDGKHLSAEEVSALKFPVISKEIVVQVLDNAVLSAVAKYCGKNWQERAYVPLMYKMNMLGLTPVQVGYVRTMHVIAMNFFKPEGTCAENLSGVLENWLLPVNAQ